MAERQATRQTTLRLRPSGACNAYSPNVANLNNIRASKAQDFTGTGNCPPAPLSLCTLVDNDFGLAPPTDVCLANVTTNSCPDRLGFAGGSLTFGGWPFVFIASDPAIAGTDCRFGKFGTLLGSEPAFSQTILQLENFVLYFLGCPYVGTEIGPLTDGLLPAPLLGQGFHFTTADVQALSDDFVIGIEDGLSLVGAPGLTSAQITAIQAELTYLQNNLTGVVKSSTFTFSSCGDAGH